MTSSEDPLDRYRAHVIPEAKVSIAESLITFWDRPWSHMAKRFACFALVRACAHGLDVMEYEPNTRATLR